MEEDQNYSELTTPTHSQSSYGTPNPPSSIDKKKIKLLKAALRDEREIRSNLEKELEAASSKIKQLEVE